MPNYSAYCPAITLQTGSSGSLPAIKWYPGHYVTLDKYRFSASQQAADFAVIDALASNSNITGFSIRRYWDELEGSTLGDYSSGFANLDAYLAKCASVGKKFILSMDDRQFGAAYTAPSPTNSDMQGFCPNYLLTSTYGTVSSSTGQFGGAVASPADVKWSGSLRAIIRTWAAVVNDRRIALSAAYADRYDTNETLAMFYTEGESSVGGPPTSFSYTTYKSEFERFLTAAKSHWLKTPLRSVSNYWQDSQYQSHLDFCAANQVMVGGPDTSDSRNVTTDRYFVHELGTTDYRGIMPWVAEYQNPAVSYYGTPQQEYNFAFNTMQMSFMLWPRSAGVAAPKSWNDILACINANPSMARPNLPTGWT